jgi:hypothetical protein
MPIRINLKELFSADSQSIVIDKINFNFNKLLELGIGEQGERGFAGFQGAAGPIGLTGEQGVRGATWYVDSAANPNTLTFTDLLSGDLYLDSNNLAIWQYDGTQWNFVVDLTNVINNYLTASPSPFKRGFGIGTPNDNRFILFNKRDDTTDSLLGLNGATSQNDILFLNNYDEDTISPFNFGPAVTPSGSQTDTNDYYNALLSVSVDHTSLSTGRYHLEMGSLYLDGVDPKLSPTYENLKIRYVRELSSQHVGLDHYNLGVFSLDLPETILDPTKRTANGVFQFNVPKLLPLTENSNFSIYLGSKYGLDEVAANGSGYINSDGVLFSSGLSFGNIGFIEGYQIPNYPTNTGYVTNSLTNAYLWLESLDANGVIIDDSLLQNGGNIIQLGTTVPRLKATVTSEYGAPNTSDFLYSGAITILGNEVYTGFGNNNIYNGGFTNPDLLKFGYFNKFSISDPNNPTSDFITASINYIKFDGNTLIPFPGNDCNQIYTLAENPIGPGLKDMVSDGDYIYAVNSQRLDKNPAASTSGGKTYAHTAFQILKKNSKNSIGLTRISRLGLGSTNGGSTFATEINGASRIKLFGKYAIIATNTLQGWNTPLNISDTALNTYDGRITAIDVSDPLNPRIEASASVIPTKVLTAPSTTALLDLDIIDDYAFVLTWEQTNGTTSADVQVRFDVFDLRGLKRDNPSTSGTIQWIGRGQIPILSSTGLNAGQISALSKTGAISTDGRYVYVGYDNSVYRYSFNTLDGGRSGSFPDCYSQYPREDQLPVAGVSSRKIVDMKVLGNSLYVLLSNSSSGQFVKFEIRDTLTQSYSRNLTGQAVSRFENSGKHFYIACQNSGSGDTNTNSLIALDFDGFYTAGANIESLRADEVNVTKDLKVGGSVNIATSLNVGSGAQIQGHLGVEKAIQTPYLINDEGNLNIVAGGTARDVNITATDDVNITAADEVNITSNTNDVNITATDDVNITAADEVNITSNTNDVNITATSASGLIKLDSNDTQILVDDVIFIHEQGTSAGNHIAIQADAPQPANYSSLGTFPFQLNAHISASGNHTAQLTNFTAKYPAIASGTYQIPASQINNAPTDAILNWQKIGNIVHVTGVVNMTNDSATGNGLIKLPIAGLTISNFAGHGVIFVIQGTAYLPVAAVYSFPDKFYFEFSGGAVNNAYGGGIQNVQGQLGDGSSSPLTAEKVVRQSFIHFTISYKIS